MNCDSADLDLRPVDRYCCASARLTASDVLGQIECDWPSCPARVLECLLAIYRGALEEARRECHYSRYAQYGERQNCELDGGEEETTAGGGVTF